MKPSVGAEEGLLHWRASFEGVSACMSGVHRLAVLAPGKGGPQLSISLRIQGHSGCHFSKLYQGRPKVSADERGFGRFES